MAYGKISEVFWLDDKIRKLSERARYFMLYLMSCPHGNRLGLFVLDLGYAASDLSCGNDIVTGEPIEWEPLHVAEVLGELRAADRIGWDVEGRVVFVRHYLRHNPLANESVVKGALNDLLGVPDTYLLNDLLEAVLEEQRGPAGPIRSYMGILQVELERRTNRNGGNGAAVEEKHRVPHGAVHGVVHGATQSRARACPTVPNPTVPDLASPDLTDPPRTDRGEHGGEDEQSLEKEINDSLPQARASIVQIHGGTEEPVEIIEGKNPVGVGFEINAYRELCRTGVDPPHIIAAAIAYIPEVTELGTPVSLARWNADDDGAHIYEQCVGLAYKAMPATIDVGTGLQDAGRASQSLPGDLDARKKQLREQIATLKARAAE